MSLKRSQVRRSQRKRHATSVISEMANWYECGPVVGRDPEGTSMEIVARVVRKGVLVAEATYRSGFHVEVRVGKQFQRQQLHIPLTHSENVELKGTWERALDRYFNEGRFSSTELLLPGEIPRVDSAREHKSLFRQAVLALRKDLEPLGYTVEIEYR